MFEFDTINSDKKTSARTGKFFTPHGVIQTPVFMPVGTKASVKTLDNKDLEEIDAEIILANTYHLHLRPGEKLISEMGGLHKWINWNRPMLTDSGGFQVFSLAEDNKKQKIDDNKIKTKVVISDDGVEFKSHLDGSTHYLTPETAIEIEHKLGADIIMAFDECANANSSKEYFTEAMIRTHNWAERCKAEHEKLNKNQDIKQALFPIVQGGIYKDLRIESAKFIDNLDMPGNAIGGLSVGESKEIMYEMLETTDKILSKNKPRYLMGVGTPEDILESVERGVDMMDCVHSTRMSRHGAFWTLEGRFNIKNEQFKKDQNPLLEDCNCYACKTYSRSYLRHLIIEKEILGLRMLSLHNTNFLLNLMSKIRSAINENKFQTFKKDFLKRFNTKK